MMIDNYKLPNHQDYNASGPFSILIDIEGAKPLLHVPRWLQCFRGNPMHLNLSPPSDPLLGDKWKWACWDLFGLSYERFTDRYTFDALMELVDKYFRNYPWKAK
jgi:hypothetical protein